MSETIYWSKSGEPVRTAVVELCGWCNKLGNATPMGKRIARTEWCNLSPAAKRVLLNHGITE
jgi:hypothetical protein